MKKIMFTISFCTIIPFSLSQADYFVKMPLEKIAGGHLQDGSIQFVSNEPVFDVPDPLPTDPGVTCKFNLDYANPPLSAYVTGYNSQGYPYSEVIFENQYVINGFKGKLMPITDPNATYYETCISGEPLYNNQDDNAPDQEWDQDNCRYNYNTDSVGQAYYWKEFARPEGVKVFTDAKLGSFGTVTYNSTDVKFPAGTINNTSGVIFPSYDSRIIKGNTAFYKGNLGQSLHLPNGDIVDIFAVCKKTAK